MKSKLITIAATLLLNGCAAVPIATALGAGMGGLNTCKATSLSLSGKTQECTLTDYVAARTAEITTAATVMRDLHSLGGKGATSTGQTVASQGTQVVKPMMLATVLVEIPVGATEAKSPAMGGVLQKIGGLAAQTGGAIDLSPADVWTRKQLADGASNIATLANLSLVIKDTGGKSVSPGHIVVRLRREIPPTVTLQP